MILNSGCRNCSGPGASTSSSPEMPNAADRLPGLQIALDGNAQASLRVNQSTGERNTHGQSYHDGRVPSIRVRSTSTSFIGVRRDSPNNYQCQLPGKTPTGCPSRLPP